MVSSIINVSLLFSLMPTFFASLPIILSNAVDTLRPGHSMRDGKTLISAGEIFELGFFSPGSSKNRYVGIWYYNFSTNTVLWVGNRENPVPDTSGALAMGDDGNLVVLDGTKSIIWSSNVSLISKRSLVQLLDTGNLVLNNSGNVAWQSFDHPTDTYLPGMKIGLDLDTNVNQLFTSWRSKDDPGVGNFSVGMDPRRSTQIFLWEGTKPRWRSGPWNGQVFIGVENMLPTYIYGFKLNNFEQEHKMYFYYNVFNSSHRYVLTLGGTEEHLVWEDDTKNWTQLWAQPITDCEFYNKCGNYASCTNGVAPTCSCLKGFVPVSEEEWDVGIWSSGCTRRTPLQCETNASTAKADADGFWKLQDLKLPDLSAWDSNDVDQNTCQQNCMRNCSCKAYAFVTGIGCLVWDVDLVDVHVFSNGGNDLYLRLAASELDETKKVPAFFILIIVLPVILIVGCIYLSWKSMSRINGFIKSWKTQGVGLVDFSGGREGGKCPDLEDSKELPQLSFDFIAATTGNFSPANFLGMGGFGPVYKGMFPGGQEIAVKRLSRSSGQGMEEFKNEVIVIAKLQHRNLVRLLGYSIQDEEKLLIYEYMPNRSLDAFLFDSTNKLLLDWKSRHNIIDGIARGLLYLHRDSRLRIIHRDLKVSNILLDEEMNPKISDFGMARIFLSDDKESNTRRVVGTYGYMSPEYAMNGLFSVKSDVYSFGVLLLEIVSGQKNSTYHHPELSLNLLSYAWKLWNEDNVIEFVDPSIRDTCSQSEVWRCVCIGLLCVQHSATDRPTMSSVVIMLESETTIQLLPKQPTFSMERSSSETDTSTADLIRANSNPSSIPMPTGR